MTRGQVAKSVRQDKESHPERYCPERRCLWKTAEVGPDGEYILNADPCRKHPELNTALPARVRALAEDTFSRIEGSIEARDAFHRTHGGTR